MISEQYPSTLHPKSMRISSPNFSLVSPVSWWGTAAWGPKATIVSKDVEYAPSVRMWYSSSAATSVSVMSSLISGRSRRNPSSAMSQARAMAASSQSFLTAIAVRKAGMLSTRVNPSPSSFLYSG